MPKDDIESIIKRFEQGSKRSSSEHFIVITLLGLLVVLVGMLLLSNYNNPIYVAGKYGKQCYKEAPSSIKHEVKFFTLEDCLEFVGK